MGEAATAGHFGRPLPPGLSCAVVLEPDRPRLGSRPWPGILETRLAPFDSHRQRFGHDRRRNRTGTPASGHCSRDNAAVLALPERQAGILLGAGRGTLAGDVG